MWRNDWYQMFHILTPYQATRTITTLMSLTRYCMYDPFTTPWVRSGDEFMSLWIRPYAKFMTQEMRPVDALMRPWIRPDIPNIAPWLTSYYLLKPWVKTECIIWDIMREIKCFIQIKWSSYDIMNAIKCPICWHQEWTQMLKVTIMSGSYGNIFSHSWLIYRYVARVTRRVPLVEQAMYPFKNTSVHPSF